MKVSKISLRSDGALIAACSRIISGNEFFSRSKERVKVEVSVYFDDGCHTWPAITSTPNSLYRALKSVKGIKRVRIGFVSGR